MSIFVLDRDGGEWRRALIPWPFRRGATGAVVVSDENSQVNLCFIKID